MTSLFYLLQNSLKTVIMAAVSWLVCEISEGMFSDEVTVKVQSSSGDAIAVFVPKAKVQREPPRVSVLKIASNNNVYAILPDDQGTAVAVPDAALQPA